MSRSRAADAAIALGAMALVFAAAVFAVLSLMHGRAADMPPSPGFRDIGDLTGGPEDELDADGFPVVDWAWWKSENPDVIGWITIPGTSVDHPVVQAPAEDPDYYLYHDAHGGWNWYGAIYLDAECAESGLMGSANAVIQGHHMDDGSMFAPLACYGDAGWASAHAEVLLQTPEEKARLTVLAADVADASSEPKRVLFSDSRDYLAWAGEAVSNSDVVLDAETVPERMYTLATCSYHTWWDERTLVYATPANREGS